jgi:hypothetical protein
MSPEEQAAALAVVSLEEQALALAVVSLAALAVVLYGGCMVRMVPSFLLYAADTCSGVQP